MQIESPTCYVLSEGMECLPKEREIDTIKDCSYKPYSPTKYPTPGQKRKRAPEKETVAKKLKAKKIKQEPKGTSQRALDEWLQKDTSLKGILKIQSSSSSRNEEETEEGEIFDPSVALDGLAQQWKQDSSSVREPEPFRNSSTLTHGSTEIFPVHPNDTLQNKEINTQYGQWEYYKCPVQNCFVTCGVDNVEYYSESAKRQLHNFYLVKSMHAMKCYCHRPLIMSKSQSEKNPGRLFLKCSKQRCAFFQWVNEKPRGKSKAWMEGGRFRGAREGYPRPRELFKPLQKEIERQKAEILEKEEKIKRRTEELRERDRVYSQKLRNGTPEEWQRGHLYQEELKRNGGRERSFSNLEMLQANLDLLYFGSRRFLP